MSDVSHGPDWWRAADGKWYPPRETEEPPEPGWWLAADGRWYPPRETEEPPEPGWWLAADGRWYPPELRSEPSATAAPTEPTSARSPAKEPGPKKAVAKKAVAKKAVARKAVAKKAVAKKAAAKKAVAEDASADARTDPTGPTSTPRGAQKPAPPKAASPTAASPKAASASGRATPPARSRPDPRPPAPAVTPPGPPQTPARAPDERVRPRAMGGMSPEQQIQRRNAASREDAVAQAPARIAAAARALQSLSLELATERDADQARADRLTPAAERAAKPSTTAATAPSAPSASEAETPAAATEAETPAAATSQRERGRPSDETPSPGVSPDARTPLLEVKPSPLGSDLEHIGDRLAIFPDRVELRDRLDRVRQVIAGDAIADVVVHKKLTGAVLSIESAKGPAIVAKGLRPDQAEEVRLLILRKTRSVGPVTRPTPTSDSRRGGAEQPDAEHPEQRPGAAAPLDENELLRMLTDLHRAGVITSAELEDKVALVHRLAQGSRLTVTPT